jgi:DNA mismatch repair ATPase MutS
MSFFPIAPLLPSDTLSPKDTHFTYSYELKPGVNRDSHGLKVAKLAGLPPSALEVASITLAWLKEQDKDKHALPELNISLSKSKVQSDPSFCRHQ